MAATCPGVLGQLADAVLPNEQGGGMRVSWHRQLPTAIIQSAIGTDGGGEQGSGRPIYGWQHAAATTSAAVPSTAPASCSTLDTQQGGHRWEEDQVVLLETTMDISSSTLLRADALAAAATASMADQQGHGAGGGEQQRQPAAAVAAAGVQQAGGSQGLGSPAGITGNRRPLEEQQEELAVAAGPAAKRRRYQSQCVCLGELQVVLKLMVRTRDGDVQPIDLLEAYNSDQHPYHQLARAMISQVGNVGGKLFNVWARTHWLHCWLLLLGRVQALLCVTLAGICPVPSDLVSVTVMTCVAVSGWPRQRTSQIRRAVSYSSASCCCFCRLSANVSSAAQSTR